MVKKFKLKNGIDVEIAFSDDRQFMRVNEIAAKFNKKPNDWMRNHRTKEYMDALLEDLADRGENSRNELNTRLDLFLVKRGGRSQGTWIHPGLVVEFARWVNPRFAVWCDQIMKQILEGTHSVIAAPKTFPEIITPVVVTSETVRDLTVVDSSDIVMTLKDIVDIINKKEREDGEVDSQGKPKTRHSESMKKIEKLSQEPGFGLVRKTRTKQKTGFGEKEIETYAFTKKQSIAAGARINNAYLMQVIDEVERLTKLVKTPQVIQVPQTLKEALLLAVAQEERIEQMQIKQNVLTEKLVEAEPKIELVKHIASRDGSVSVTEWVNSMNNRLKEPIKPLAEAMV